MTHHCDDFTRAHLLRNVARAGRGLPEIEPGMPAPAGTGLSRRSFLSRTAGLALAVYGASTARLPAFDAGIAEAAAVERPVLVSVFLPGGLDSLSVLAPVGDPLYSTMRPTLALSPSDGPALPEDSRLMWHPGAQGLATLH